MALVTAAVVAVQSPARATSPAPLAGADDLANVVHYEQLMQDHMRQGHAVEVDFDSPQRVAGHVVGTGGWGDSGLWTGVYLGGESMRYAVAKHKLAGALSDGDRLFWTGQRDAAMTRVREIVRAEHIDINIAEDWTGELRMPPDVNTDENPTEARHLANWGGGVIHGEKGMIQRACTPVGLGKLGVNDPTVYPDKPVNNNDNRVFQITWKHGDGKTYNCETSPSRDTYAGLIFGLLTAFDLVTPDAPDLRRQIRTDLVAMGNFLWKYKWNYPRPHGYVSVEHDFNGFFSPLFVYTPEARLNVANAVHHVVSHGGSRFDKAKWTAIWAEELATQGPGVGVSLQFDALQPHDSYYKWNLSHLNAFNLMRTNSGAARSLLGRGIAAMDKTTRDDVNAHFEAIMFSITGEQSRLDASVTHLRQWLDYRANIEAGPVKNSSRCGHDISCVPEDQYAFALPVGPLVWFPGTEGSRASLPLPVAQRTPTDFLWQRSPDQLDGTQPPTHRTPGIDFLTPYWMIRYFTEVARPPVSHLPAWPLPASI
jgi:hypothetical protein